MRERLERLKSASAQEWDEIKKPWQKKEGNEDDEDDSLQETSIQEIQIRRPRLVFPKI